MPNSHAKFFDDATSFIQKVGQAGAQEKDKDALRLILVKISNELSSPHPDLHSCQIVLKCIQNQNFDWSFLLKDLSPSQITSWISPWMALGEREVVLQILDYQSSSKLSFDVLREALSLSLEYDHTHVFGAVFERWIQNQDQYFDWNKATADQKKFVTEIVHEAASLHRLDILKLLHENFKCPLNVLDPLGLSPLQTAIKNNPSLLASFSKDRLSQLVYFLVSCGCDVNGVSNSPDHPSLSVNHSPLFLTVMQGEGGLKISCDLIDLGASVQMLVRKAGTPYTHSLESMIQSCKSSIAPQVLAYAQSVRQSRSDKTLLSEALSSSCPAASSRSKL